MNIKDRIGTHLPYLRRFARVLSGNQQSGDAYVLAMLEALVANPSDLRTDIDDRIAVYQYFLKIWSMSSANTSEKTSALADNTTSLASLTPLPRQAFLLTSVEGFSTDEATHVMDIPAEEFSILIDKAGQEIARQVSTDILIIEDEPIIAMDLEAIVEELGHTVTSIARTHSEAVKASQSRRPGLVLADIQLADGSSGLEAVNEILSMFEVPVIFITAYPERLLTGEKPEPAFLITKPFQTKALKAIISQAIFFREKAIRRAA